MTDKTLKVSKTFGFGASRQLLGRTHWVRLHYHTSNQYNDRREDIIHRKANHDRPKVLSCHRHRRHLH